MIGFVILLLQAETTINRTAMRNSDGFRRMIWS